MKAIIASAIIMTCSIVITGCAMFTEKDKSGTNSDAISGGDTRKLLVGTWKITSVRCDGKGNNCETYQATRFLTYDKSGELFVNDVKRGSYRVSGNICTIDTGRKQYNVKIIYISNASLITGESHRATTEKFLRVQ